MKYPNLKEEKNLWNQGYKFVVGLDEAGRGPLAGPVVAAAVTILNPKHEIRNPKQYQNSNFQNSKHVSDFDIRISSLKIRDSKQLSEKKREEIYTYLTEHPTIQWGIGLVSETIIDKINILEATKLAMKRAIKNLQVTPEFLILDGNFKITSKIPQKSIIRGDEKVFSCTLAGIIAKVTRDKIMQTFHKKYPQYEFNRHKGYGTNLHIKNLKMFGACKIHRKTFWPVSNIAKN